MEAKGIEKVYNYLNDAQTYYLALLMTESRGSGRSEQFSWMTESSISRRAK